MGGDKILFQIYCGLVFLIIVLALFGPYFMEYNPYVSDMRDSILPPTAEHIFGTDKLGRDVFTRIVYGARVSISMAFACVILNMTIGMVVGIVAGYFGGKVDVILMRFTDMMLSFPGMVLALAIAGVLGGSILNTIIAIVAVSWTKYARLSRSMTLKVAEREFLSAAVTNGTRPFVILYRHIFPNILPMIVVTGAMDIGSMMMELAGLSFLGFGAQPPTPEWGLMLNEGRQVLQTAPWLMLYPGLAILIVVSIFNLWGDALRDVLDPRKTN